MIIENVKEAVRFIRQPLSPYWQKHYSFGKLSSRSNEIGKGSVENVIINSFVPLLAAYAKHVDDVRFIEKAESLLSGLHPEVNRITKEWTSSGIKAENAADTQALIYHYQSFCEQKRCLQCNIGISILNK